MPDYYMFLRLYMNRRRVAAQKAQRAPVAIDLWPEGPRSNLEITEALGHGSRRG